MWYQYYFTGLHQTPVLYAVISSDCSTSTLVFQWIPVLAFSAMRWENIFIVVSLCHSECDQTPLDSGGVWLEYVGEGKVLNLLQAPEKRYVATFLLQLLDLTLWLEVYAVYEVQCNKGS